MAATITSQLMDGLKTIDQSYLTEKSKVWCYQHTLYHRVMWPLKGKEITTSAAIRMDAKVNNFIWKWLGLSQHSTLLGTNALPLKSINLGYKHEKTRLVFQLRDSPDPTIRNTRAQPADAAEGHGSRAARQDRLWLGSHSQEEVQSQC